MDQGGFDFRKPSERREARRFEPPPWEEEAFEELRRKREQAEEQAKGDGRSQAERPEEAAPAAERPSLADPVRQEPEQEQGERAAESQTEARGEIDEALMIEMIAGLASEGPRTQRMTTGLMLGVSAFLALFGLGLTVWGGVITAKAQGSGRLLAMVLLVMGLAYLGVGAGLGYRALKERGVL